MDLESQFKNTLKKIELRGHHMKDFWDYLFMRDKKYSHEYILDCYIRFDKSMGDLSRGEFFERHVFNLLRNIYNLKVSNIILISTCDDICNGLNDSPEDWCKFYSDECINDKILLEEDVGYINSNGFNENDSIDTYEFVERIRKEFVNYALMPK